tara:strand:+ start:275 stop:550 length:276 start_codon:yes stop_codon:yes gene_type:complete
MDKIDIAFMTFSVVMVLIPITGIFVGMPIMYFTPLLNKLVEQSYVWADKHGEFRANWALFFSIGCVVWFLIFLVLYTNNSFLYWFVSTFKE